MFDTCAGCNTNDRTTFKFWKITAKGDTLVWCRTCFTGKSVAIPDVYYGYGSGEHVEENIAYPNGHPKSGQPIPFHDKASKKLAMDIAGVREAGDAVHGARKSYGQRKTFFT